MSDSSIPSIRTFQMDASTVGVLKSSVNLFRGDINLTQTLFSMPGRTSNDGLQVDVAIQYQSNINLDAMTWNRDRPTGVLGLGWQLPLSVISYDNGGSVLPGTGTYTLSIAGNSSQLVQEPNTPFLFDLDASLASSLVGGKPVPAAVRAAFVGRGLPLSTTALIVGNASPWTIQDDEQEQMFLLASGSGALKAYDGGQSFQLVNYKFWKVLYYPQYERWVVTNDSGQRMSFGGGVTRTTQGYNSSAGNSIEWGVQWLDGNGVAVWEGNSAVSAGQGQVARAWHLQKAYSRFGEYISYGYNEFPRDNQGLLENGAEQLVGVGGKPYTKACYLTSVTDVFGRRASFNYSSKLWSNATSSSAREYADPHKAVPDTSPNGYQDRYETQYLDHVVVSHTNGATLFTVDMVYDPSPANAGQQAVANVAGSSGDTSKRLLTAYLLANPEGESLPGYRFDYNLNTAVQTNLGALSSMTWPTGGKASYAYQSVDLDICERELATSAPAPLPAQSIPRVWFGPDYAVVIWNNTGSQLLSLQIYTWNGQWNAWQPAANSPLLLEGNGGTDPTTLNVLTGQDFVGVVFDTSQNTNLHLFRKDPARRAQWVAAVIPGGGNGGCNSPTWTWSKANGKVNTYAGKSFVLATQMNTSQNKGSYDVFTWQWPTQSWGHSSQTTVSYTWFATGSNYFATVDMASNVALAYLTPTGQWQQGSGVNLGFSLSNFNSLAVASDQSTLAVSHLISGGPSSGQQSYDVYLLQWNAGYALGSPSKFSFTDKFDKSYPSSWAPAVVANSLVAVSGNLMRYDGQAWLANSNLKPAGGSVYGQQRYAYGPDFGTLILVNGNNVSGQLLGYDANANGNTWSGTPTSISGLSVPSTNPSTSNWAAAGNPDFLTLGTQLYFRGVASNWQNSIGQSIADIQALINQSSGGGSRYQLNSASVINEGPAFIACAVYDNQSAGHGRATASSALVLRNGTVYGPVPLLSGQQMWTAQENDQGNSGLYPGGPSSFYTYPDSANNLDSATTVYLHRYAGDAVSGPISDWPVASITIDDGLAEAFTTAYVQNTATAACDASGEVVKYYESVVYPGGNAASPVNGWVTSNYLNGADTDLADYYDMLDGLLEQVATYDQTGKLLASNTSTWTAYVKRAADPVDGGVAPVQLYGAYVLQTEQQSISDGVSSTQLTSYMPGNLAFTYTGQPASTSLTTLNGAGQQETDVQASTYACEVNPVSRVLNDVASSVQQQTSNGGVATGASVTALTPWPTLWGSDVLTPAEEADFAWTGGPVEFPFASYRAGDVPTDWQLTTRNQLRASDGSVLQQTDGAGTPCSTIFGTTLGFPVATFKAAILSECAWNGFQPYEAATGWDLQGTSINTENAWLGTQSLNLPEGARIGTQVTPGAGRSRYLLGLRYQTPAGYSSSGPGITLQSGSQSASASFADTAGQWRYLTLTLDLPGDGSLVALEVSNTGSWTVLLDGVLLVPFGTDVTVQSWHQDTRLLRASMNAGGSTSFTLYDNFNRSLGAVGADGQLQELDIRFQSRQGSTTDSFDNASPNAELTLHCTGGGIAETFVDGGAWAARWKPGNAALWSTAGGVLSKASATADTLTWEGQAAGLTAFFLELVPPASLGGTMSLSFGGGQQIAWNPGQGWTWTDTGGQPVQAPLAQPPHMAEQWLLVLGQGQLLFFGNGQLLFSQASAATAAQGCVFHTGSNALQITNLAYARDPRVGLSYTDGAARQRQVHQLHDDDSRVMEIIYDALDRQLAATRVAPGRFGTGASIPVLQYRNSFVDVPAFLASLKNTWAMQGDVSAYYAGQVDGPIVRSNDQDYPYSGIRYEASAQNRIVESGKPGLQLAIHDVNTTTPAQRETTRTSYGASTSSDPVEAGQYFATSTLTPGGYQGRQLVDTANRAVATLQLDQSGINVGQSTAAPSYSANAGSAGTLGTLTLPNAYTQGPQGNPPAFFRTMLQNPLGQACSYSDPDTGTTEYLFNGKGQQRFVRVPLETGEQYFLYTRYDALGRTVEEGTVQAAWNTAVLTAEVNNLAYPTAADGAVVARRYDYDGDGSNPNDIGRMTHTQTLNLAPEIDSGLGAVTVDERWQYDELGRVTSASLGVSGAVSLTAAVNYHYNNLNEIVQIDFPAGSPLASVTYQYDDQGHIVAIGVPGNDTAIASYAWNADGQLETATRGALAEVWNYDSPGNVLNHQVTAQGNVLLRHDFTYTPDSQIETRQTTVGFSGANSDRTVTYSYDGQQRMSAAVVSNGQPGNQSISEYDANGNIWRGSEDGKAFSASCAPGTDQLTTATLPNGNTVSFHYRANGCPEQWRGLSMEYDPALTIVNAVGTGSSVVRYARGLNNQRILRQQGSDVQLCLQGAGNTPLVIWVNGQPQICIWGPDGLAAVHDGNLKYPVSDHQHTVWLVADSDGSVVASYDYQPFGGIISQSGSAAASWLFQYAGKQWDASLGLYDFGARLYDPALLRFTAPDPVRQFASPYVFASNNPMNMVDPSGNISIWAQVGIGAAMVAVIAAGIALSFVTFGAAAPAAAAADTALAGAAVTGEAAAAGTAAAAAGGEAAAAGAAAGEAVVEGAALGAGEVAAGAGAGVEATVPLTTAQVVGQNIASVAWSATTSAITGAGTSGLSYDIQHGRDFTAKGFFTAMGVGALSGAVSGGIGGLASMPATVGLSQGMSITASVAFRALTQATASMIGNDVATLLTDAITGQKITAGQLLLSSAQGFGTGALSGTFSALGKIKPEATAVSATDRALVRASTALNSAAEAAKSAATSQAAIAAYIAGGYFLVSGYAVWGVYQGSKQ